MWETSRTRAMSATVAFIPDGNAAAKRRVAAASTTRWSASARIFAELPDPVGSIDREYRVETRHRCSGPAATTCPSDKTTS